MKSREEKDLRTSVEELLAENVRLEERCKAVRQGAHDWKMRARAAEKRCVELLEERMQREKEHSGNLNIIAGELAEADKRMLELQQELQQARFGREELRYELVRVKAHAYDLAFGDEQHDED